VPTQTNKQDLQIRYDKKVRTNM